MLLLMTVTAAVRHQCDGRLVAAGDAVVFRLHLAPV